jgi:hypothetical protein
MAICIHPDCNNAEMTEQQREAQFLAGWVGVTMYDHICSECFDLLKEEE